MKPQRIHDLLPQQTAEEALRESCVASMRKFFSTELIPANRELYLPTRDGSVIVDLGRLNRIIEINEEDMFVTVEAVFLRHGCAHLQIAKSYPYRIGREPATWALLQAIKSAVDPKGLVNPGALGLGAGT